MFAVHNLAVSSSFLFKTWSPLVYQTESFDACKGARGEEGAGVRLCSGAFVGVGAGWEFKDWVAAGPGLVGGLPSTWGNLSASFLDPGWSPFLLSVLPQEPCVPAVVGELGPP